MRLRRDNSSSVSVEFPGNSHTSFAMSSSNRSSNGARAARGNHRKDAWWLGADDLALDKSAAPSRRLLVGRRLPFYHFSLI
mgnify:CR=1 FL=1